MLGNRGIQLGGGRKRLHAYAITATAITSRTADHSARRGGETRTPRRTRGTTTPLAIGWDAETADAEDPLTRAVYSVARRGSRRPVEYDLAALTRPHDIERWANSVAGKRW